MKYDYVVVSCEDRSDSEVQDALDQAGYQGYHVVGVLGVNNDRVVMERPERS